MGAIACVRGLWSQQYAMYVRRFLPPWKWLLASTEGCSLVASLLTLLSLASLGLARENRYSSEIVWLEKLWILFKPLP